MGGESGWWPAQNPDRHMVAKKKKNHANAQHSNYMGFLCISYANLCLVKVFSHILPRAKRRTPNPMDLIDLTADTQFHQVPDPILTQLPTSVALVHDFVNYPLPPKPVASTSTKRGNGSAWIIERTFPEVLLIRPVPPEKVLETLNATAGQMWFDGACSIVDPRFNNGTERFPLWVLSLERDRKDDRTSETMEIIHSLVGIEFTQPS